MPAPTARPWSTQYRQDYRATPSGRQSARPRPKSAHVSSKTSHRVPAATPLFAGYQTETVTEGTLAHTAARPGVIVIGLPPGMGSNADLKIVGNSVVITPRETIARGITTKDAGVQVDEQIRTETEPRIPAVGTATHTTHPIDNIHWICWPEPKPAPPRHPKRPQTSLGFHRGYTVSGDAGTRDDLAVVGDAGDMNLAGYVQPMNFDPGFNTWNNCSKRDGLQNIGSTMSSLKRSNTFHHEATRGPMTSISINEPRDHRDSYTAYNGHRPSYAGQNGNPAMQYQNCGVDPGMMVNGYTKRIEGHQALPSVYRSRFNKYPLLSRQPRYPSKSDDYVHEYSMFMSTTPRVTGHFIIHPDWVSEKGGLKRSRSVIQQSSKDGDRLRY